MTIRSVARIAVLLGLAGAQAADAQQTNLRIGYVYPAGGKQGTTFEAVVGGQFLTGLSRVEVSGNGVQATITELIQPTNTKELNRLRIQMDELMARRAVVRKDFAALERFRSFKTAKNIKTDDAARDKELEELKKKYANATWTAADEKLLAEVRRKIGMAVRRPANPAISEIAVLQVSVAADAEPGQRELRVGNAVALSNPLVFCIGHLPEFSEPPTKTITQQASAVQKTALAPKSRRIEADAEITLPAVVNGQILPGEVDRYRFQARKGQRLVVAASARQLIPYLADAVPGWFQATLALCDAQGKELAYADDFRFHPDPVLFCEIPADGQYVIEIKDAIYRGREDFVYRITAGELPFVTSVFPLGAPAGGPSSVELSGWNLPADKLALGNQEKTPGIHPLPLGPGPWISNPLPFAVDTLPECLEQEPNQEPGRAQRVVAPVIVNGRIDSPADVDVFSFEGRAGDRIVAEVYARRLDSPLDSLLKLTDAGGRQLAFNDDHEDKGAGLTTHHADSWLSAVLPADGTYFVHLSDAQRKGGPEYAYRLRISPPRPDFDLRVVPSSINARAGATVPVTVYALRKDGFDGDIALELRGAPAGFSLSGAWVPGGQDRVRLTLSVPSGGAEEPVSLQLEGRATIDGREVRRPVVPADDMTQAFEYRHLVPAKQWRVAVAGSSGRYRAAAPRIAGPLPLKIPAGGTAQVRLDVPGSRAVAGQFRLQLSDPPEGITLKNVAPSSEGAELVLASDAEKVKPGLKGNLIVAASSARSAPSKAKAKPLANARGAPAAVLPAIPFEIVAP